MDKKYCVGCRDDFYNGKNPHGIEKCWLLDGAKLAMVKRVHIDERPPWKAKPERLPGCYRQRGYIFVDPEVNC